MIKKNNRNIGMVIPIEHYKILKEKAKESDRSLTALLRIIIKEWIKNKK